MKKLKYIILFAAILAVVAFSACGTDADGYVGRINKSLASATAAQVEATVTDGDIKVYGYKKSATPTAAGGAEITVTESKINSEHVLTEKTEKKTEDNFKGFGSFLKIDDENTTVVSREGNTVKMTAAKDKIAAVLGVDNANASSDAEITLKFDGNKILEITCVYCTDTNKTVAITAVYSY